MKNLTLDSGELLSIPVIDYRGNDLEAKLQYRKPNKDGLSHVQTCFVTIDKNFNINWGYQHSPFNKIEIQQGFENMLLSEKIEIQNQFPEYFEQIKISRLRKRQ